METEGQHIIAELSGCDPSLIKEVKIVRPVLLEAAQKNFLTVHGDQFKQFDPCGVTGLLLLSESHLSIHTWPEHEYAAVDAYTCGDGEKALAAIRHIGQALKAKDIYIRTIDRGIRAPSGRYHSMELAQRCFYLNQDESLLPGRSVT